MFTKEFYTKANNNYQFSRQQGSDFAKLIARDFNPLHDVDNSRFCVPGDLLFALMLSQFGLRQSMTFDFQGMVSGDMPIHFEDDDSVVTAKNDKQKTLLSVSREGEKTNNSIFIEGLIRAYVAFSGKTFPHIIIDLMKKENVMINTRKPMVIYDQMSLSFVRFSEIAPEVVLHDCDFDVNGKRGMVTMNFDLRADDESIGRGEKQIIMSGLRPYEQSEIDFLVQSYNASKANYEV